MNELVEQIARKFADSPGDIAVAEICGARTHVMELRCSKGDVGRMIGRNGRTIGAMRTLLDALAWKSKKRVILEVVGRE